MTKASSVHGRVQGGGRGSGAQEWQEHRGHREGSGSDGDVAALEVASGKVHGRCFSRHTHVEFIAFLESIAKRYPRRELHLICDNCGTHEHPNVKEGLAEHPRFKLHFTPTSASWLDLVERWFALITDQAIRRGSFDSVKQLERTIMRHLGEWNEDAKRFVWTKSTREIKRKIRRVSQISETGHQVNVSDTTAELERLRSLGDVESHRPPVERRAPAPSGPLSPVPFVFCADVTGTSGAVSPAPREGEGTCLSNLRRSCTVVDHGGAGGP